MDNNRVHIDELFREGLQHHEVLPPPDGWSSLKPLLLPKPAVSLLRRVAAVAVVLVTSSLTFWYVQRDVDTLMTGTSTTIAGNPLLAGARGPKPAPLHQTPVLFDPMEPAEPRVQKRVQKRIPHSEKIQKLQAGHAFRWPQQNHNSLPAGKMVANGDPNGFSDYPLEGKNRLPAIADAGQATTSKWSVGAQVSPTYSFRRLSLSTDDVHSDNLGVNEQPLLSYSGGLSMEYQLNDRLSLQTGVFYNSMGQQLNSIAVYEGFSVFTAAKSGSRMNVDYSAGGIKTTNKDIFLKDLAENRISTYYTADVFDPDKARLTQIGEGLVQSFQFLELPLIVRYKLVDRKMDIHVLGGLSTNFLVGNSTYTRSDTRKVEIGQTANLNTLNYSSSLGIGLEYDLSDQVTFNFEPVVKYYMNSLNQNNYISMHPYSFGIYSGFYYNF